MIVLDFSNSISLDRSIVFPYFLQHTSETGDLNGTVKSIIISAKEPIIKIRDQSQLMITIKKIITFKIVEIQEGAEVTIIFVGL